MSTPKKWWQINTRHHSFGYYWFFLIIFYFPAECCQISFHFYSFLVIIEWFLVSLCSCVSSVIEFNEYRKGSGWSPILLFLQTSWICYYLGALIFSLRVMMPKRIKQAERMIEMDDRACRMSQCYFDIIFLCKCWNKYLKVLPKANLKSKMCFMKFWWQLGPNY